MTVGLIALISIFISVAAQFMLKAGMRSEGVRTALSSGSALEIIRETALQPAIIGGLALYAVGAVVWLSVLAKWDVSKAYPLVGLGFVAAAVVGWWTGESIATTRLLGVGFIVLGVLLVARS
jgi:multidrug transporter EmrE-like cation transporter